MHMELGDKRAIEPLESRCRHGEQVHRHDRLEKILQEGQPAHRGVAEAADTRQTSCHAPFGDDEAEFPAQAVNEYPEQES